MFIEKIEKSTERGCCGCLIKEVTGRGSVATTDEELTWHPLWRKVARKDLQQISVTVSKEVWPLGRSILLRHKLHRLWLDVLINLIPLLFQVFLLHTLMLTFLLLLPLKFRLPVRFQSVFTDPARMKPHAPVPAPPTYLFSFNMES
jgi:hypothetical protein